MERTWRQSGDVFTSAVVVERQPKLPAAVYDFGVDQNGDWFLRLRAARFHFGFEVIGLRQDVVDRALRAFSCTTGTLGVGFSGLKGTGKSITAQVLANALLDAGVPVVLATTHPVELGAFLHTLSQDVVVLLDEFEKNFAAEAEQQQLLSVLDGTHKTAFRRMFLFTMNELLLNENMLYRPSRMRYVFRFARLSPEDLRTILDRDLLPENARFRGDLERFLPRLEVLTVDIARSVIAEVNLFQESPFSFASFFNIEVFVPHTFQILSEEGEVIVRRFVPRDRRQIRRIWDATEPTGYVGHVRAIEVSLDVNNAQMNPSGDTALVSGDLRLLAKNTWQKDFPHVFDPERTVTWEPRPSGWNIPEWVLDANATKRPLTNEEDDALQLFDGLYGTGRGGAHVFQLISMED